MKEFEITIEGKAYKVTVEDFNGKHGTVLLDGKKYNVEVSGADLRPSPPSFGRKPYTAAPGVRIQQPVSRPAPPAQSTSPVPAPAARAPSAGGEGNVNSPMPGLVLDIMVKVGDSVKQGAAVAKIEAMKMENEIPALCAGIVKSIEVKKGDSVSTGDTILCIEVLRS